MFFSLLMDRSTDKGNTDDEVFMVVWCESNSSTDEKIHTKTTYFHVCQTKSVDAPGLFQSLKRALFRLGVSDRF